MTQLDDLLAVAKAATPGEWKKFATITGYVSDENIEYEMNCIYPCGPVQMVAEYKDLPDQTLKDCTFISTFNPAFVIKLLESWAELESMLAKAELRFAAMSESTIQNDAPGAIEFIGLCNEMSLACDLALEKARGVLE